MQALENDFTHARHVRLALEELLELALTADSALIFLNATLRFHATPQARLDAWQELTDLNEKVQSLRDGADPGFDDLGDDLYVTLDRETALQRAESDLEDALNRVSQVGLRPAIRVA